jgi:hypothetical protein
MDVRRASRLRASSEREKRFRPPRKRSRIFPIPTHASGIPLFDEADVIDDRLRFLFPKTRSEALQE